LETHELNEHHPEFGRTEYKETLKIFEKEGFEVFSEIRRGNVNAGDYAIGVELIWPLKHSRGVKRMIIDGE